jgi:hypothetical protein
MNDILPYEGRMCSICAQKVACENLVFPEPRLPSLYRPSHEPLEDPSSLRPGLLSSVQAPSTSRRASFNSFTLRRSEYLLGETPEEFRPYYLHTFIGGESTT